MSKGPWGRRIFRLFAALPVLGALLIACLLAFLWVERRTEVTLPAPTGSFAVGREILDWKDDAALDPLAPVPETNRELLVWIWYPSAAGSSAAIDDYVPKQLRPLRDSAGGSRIIRLLTRDAAKVHGHSIRDGDLSPRRRSYPVVIMRAGASAEVLTYSTLAEDLASHGYVVVGFDAPYRTSVVVFPDGRTMRRTDENNPELCVVPDRDEMERCLGRVLGAWTADIGFVLDRLARLDVSDPSGRFTGRLDMTRVGVFGHSLGGAVAAQFCHEDPRCRAGIDIDGAPHGSVIGAGLHQPFMFLLSDHGDASDPASRQIEADIQTIYDRSPVDKRLCVMIGGAFHFTFSDDGALLKSSIARGVLRVLGMLGISGRRQLVVTAHCVHSFFDAHLKETSAEPEVLSPRFPEVRLWTGPPQ